MTIISHSRRFIFVHNWKVAGTSIRSVLNEYANLSFRGSPHLDKIKILLGIYPKIYGNQFQGHMSASDLRDKLPKNLFDSYFKFGFVRDPWDWQVSLYTFMLKKKDHPQHELMLSFKSFNQYIDWRVHEDLRYQKPFFYDDNECIVNYIGKFENLENDFRTVCKKIGITSDLPHLNASNSTNHLEFYTQKSIDMVSEAFAEDILTFGYEKPVLTKL